MILVLFKKTLILTLLMVKNIISTKKSVRSYKISMDHIYQKKIKYPPLSDLNFLLKYSIDDLFVVDINSTKFVKKIIPYSRNEPH